ncbi:hypothetical protein Pst134EA_003082 [Puccinia striiformis f. sp. tritici]|uniref:hypothetical protein n=1 Tax=Puccinia striiformis f. sp. tritici TaxID=168172 RepID=UPI00200745CC|nr:hypothetical protein Pst134EA_003082 [Puccinia striiformis f. sp. tritici]KAH9472472.1 hypothetical protein Pst134EA_003082 [Puccinia striiformis f. sp. tritici]
MKLEAKDNKIIVTWQLDNRNLPQFKREVIDALRRHVNEWLAVHAQTLENDGESDVAGGHQKRWSLCGSPKPSFVANEQYLPAIP